MIRFGHNPLRHGVQRMHMRRLVVKAKTQNTRPLDKVNPALQDQIVTLQNNMMEINQRRIQALEKYKATKQYSQTLEQEIYVLQNQLFEASKDNFPAAAESEIIRLKRQLEQSEQQVHDLRVALTAASAQQFQSTPAQAPAPTPAPTAAPTPAPTAAPTPAPTAAPTPAPTTPPMPTPAAPTTQSAMPPSQPPPTEPPVTKDKITIVYATGWKDAYVHFRTDQAGWTKSPGIKLTPDDEQYQGRLCITVEGKSMEFVLNDGGNKWDKLDPYGEARNYSVNQPGVYLLQNGCVQKLS